MNLISNHNALELYAKYFPDVIPNIFQQEMIEQIQNVTVWEDTLKFWVLNDYRGRSVGKMLEYYDNYQQSIGIEDVLRAYTDKDARLVEIATLQVLMTATQPIKSVNYFRPAIDDIYSGLEKVKEREMRVSSKTIDVVLARRREQYEKSRQILSTN